MSATLQSYASRLLSTSMHEEDDDILDVMDDDIDEEDEIQNSH